MPHVGVFDSGVGGLSVLRSVRQALPACKLTYLADNRHMPYGDKPSHWLEGRCLQLADHLLGAGATLILVACNTATTHTISALRARWPAVPFVGIEPGIRPAVQVSRNGRIGVMATPSTLESTRLHQLIDLHARDCVVHLMACPGLATAIEAADDVELSRLIDTSCEGLRARDVDTVVLGCTHYPLIAEQLAARLGHAVQLIDTADAVARRVKDLLPAHEAASAGDLTVMMTGDEAPITRAVERWIGAPATIRCGPR